MFVGVCAYGGERRTGKSGAGHVIIPDDRDIAGNSEARFTDGEHGTNPNRVIAGKECREARMLGQEALHGMVTACEAEISLGDERLLVRKACGVESGAIALQTSQSGDIVQ